jgi:modulator of FtsH protease HflC
VKEARQIIISIVAIIILLVIFTSAYTVGETQQVIITQFGKPVGKPITTAGLKFKLPMVQEANFIEKRILPWDGEATSMPTKDKLYITVDTFARWKVKDPLQYFLRLRDVRSALSRLDDILGSETRNAVAKHELVEIIRTTKDRKAQVDTELAERDPNRKADQLKPITKGRQTIEKEIFAAATSKLEEFGIELLDIRFKRIDYNQSVKTEIYQRMISERQSIAEGFRSEGNSQALDIQGKMEKELKRIESEAYRKELTLRGDADAEATQIYADAYNLSGEAVLFYEFLQTMETYKAVLDENTTIVLSTEGDLFKYLRTIDPPVKVAE